ncbi:DUF115 domain-containing protein [Fodinisporobacter ferrooxydans]|uniref:DUF115 domain-containing protein n=1 Tax=Fodinisporobacter ferrooxydans TaxID=2901836 RepID=A0ABY4CLM5_9BACL|nr:DUF115 domain-containing protein [Alicyclobacillaceae bacterium MYW30-H2]
MIQIVPTRTGCLTACWTAEDGQTIYLHSRYEPEREALLLIRDWKVPDNGVVVVYGLGCGYHLQALLQKLHPTQKMIVFECNRDLVHSVTKKGLLSPLLEDERFELHVYSEMEDFLSNFVQYLELAEEGKGAFFIHPSSVKIIPKQMEQVKELLEEYRIRIHTIEKKRALLENNRKMVADVLLENPNIGIAKDKFLHMPAILVAAGPSLNHSVRLLSQLKGRALIVCVGTALTPLLQNGVDPDLIVVIEGDEAVLGQFPDKECDIPLIAFPTACPKLTLHYKGPVIWAYPEGDDELVSLADRYGFPVISSGGSVATAALSILDLMGCNPIVLVGQDLAYINGRSHAQGTIHSAANEITSQYGLFAEAVGGGLIQTSRSWNIFRRWIERFIRNHKDIHFYNASHGARIAGAVERSLEELMSTRLFSELFSETYEIAKRIDALFS